MWKLDDINANMLSVAPESGMGYQIVWGKVNRVSQLVFVFNAELCALPSELMEIEARSYEDLLARASPPQDFEIDRVLSLDAFPGLTFSALASPPTAPGSFPGTPSVNGALAPSPILTRNSQAHEGFVRFSAYANDKRIGSTGGVAKGTYATTVSDARFAVSGLAVAGRYALPNPSPAIYAYTIVPASSASFQAGTARPAFTQSGGGVEVVFPSALPAGSTCRPYEIPER